MSSIPWSDDRVATLKNLWSAGLSAAQVAASLGGVTRNAVIGKLHRLGMAGRGAASRPGEAKPVRSAPARRAPRAKIRPNRPPAASQPLPRAATELAPVVAALCPLVADLVLLGTESCRWPIGDPLAAGFGFCGRDRVRGPYCADHAGLAYRGSGAPLDEAGLLRLVGRAAP